MKKVFLSILLLFLVSLTVYADNMPNLKYKNIAKNDKISYNQETGVWSHKYDKKSGNYFIKTKGFGNFYDYLDSNKDFAFSTNCEYEFIYNDKLIGYSNRYMNFYEITYSDNILNKRTLSKEEVEDIFPDYVVVALSSFSPNTNSLKIKKNAERLNIILYNDTEKTFDNYKFSSGNAKFAQYDLRGFLTVQKYGMVEFSDFSEQANSWYVLLIR